MKEICVISFGDSTKYRVSSDECKDIDKVKDEVKASLLKRFPEIAALPFYSQITVERMDAADAAQYPEFDEKALDSIKAVLDREVEDARSVDELNNDAPFSDINTEG